ncbi:MAG: SagB/ThcOx family dehydrogenase, partial [Nocardioides sp.]|nr:SagB/ThcOx family dehydrogenase [Nocardioides sp.]
MISLPGIENQQGLAGLLSSRRSTKDFDATRPLELEAVSRMLWAAAGSTSPPHRVSPSARGAYPIVVTLVSGEVNGVEPGCYRYDPLDHALAPGPAGDHRGAVAAGTLDASDWLTACPALVLITADLEAARRRFPEQPADHGERFVWMEAGHVAQNVYLLAAELGFGTCL